MAAPAPLPSQTSVERALAEIDRALPSGAVITDLDVRTDCSHDDSEAEPHLPDAVVRARSAADVSAVMAAATKHRVPVTPRAGGTGRVGGAVPVAGGIVLAFDRMEAIKGIESEELVAFAEPGVVLAKLHEAVEAQGLFFPPDPSSLGSCRLGGNVAHNAGGPRAFKYGSVDRWVLGLEVVLPDGTVMRTGKRTVKGVTGYDLTSLIVGSEGTLAVVTEICVRLVPLPSAVSTLIVMLPDVHAAGRLVSAIVAARIVPRCLELLDADTLAILRPKTSLPLDARAGAMLLVELDGDDASLLQAQAERIGEVAETHGALDVLVASSAGERERLWSARRDMSHALRKEAKFKLSEDIVVPRTRIPDLLARVAELSRATGIRMPAYGHAGDGNLHVNFLWDDESERPTVQKGVEGLFRATVEMGGTLSGEHGIGILKAPYLGLEHSDASIALQERVKATFDPHGVLNPGKIFPGAVKRFHGAC